MKRVHHFIAIVLSALAMMKTFSTFALSLVCFIVLTGQPPAQTHRFTDLNIEDIGPFDRAAVAGSILLPITAEADRGTAEILWDSWGVPHIFARDLESAA